MISISVRGALQALCVTQQPCRPGRPSAAYGHMKGGDAHPRQLSLLAWCSGRARGLGHNASADGCAAN